MPIIRRPDKVVDPKLIKQRKDPTFYVPTINPKYLPVLLGELISNEKLTIIRACNYSKILYNQLYSVPLDKLMSFFSFSDRQYLKAFTFFSSLDPGSFKLYSYWYSRMLHNLIIYPYDKEYKIISDIDSHVIQSYLIQEARRGISPRTIRTQLSAIKHMLYPFNKLFPFLYNGDIELKKIMQVIIKIFGRPVKKKLPITFFLIYKILGFIDFKKLLDVRDWILIVMCQVAGFRGGGISPITWHDVAVDKYIDTYTGKNMHIVIIFLDTTKTMNVSNGATVTISCPDERNSFNLMVLLEIYIKLLTREGFLNDYVFPSLQLRDKKKNKHINTRSVSKIIKKRVKQIGEDPKLFGAHSGRMGFVKDAIAAGIPPELIKKTGRWSSDCWLGYFHDQQYAQACATSRLQKFGKENYETSRTSKKHKELLGSLLDKQIQREL